MTGYRHRLWGAVIGLVIFAGLIAGCCEECKTPVEPTNPLIGSWECIKYILNDVENPSLIGTLMSFYRDGTGGIGTPEAPTAQEFTWVSSGEKVYVEEQELGFAIGFNHVISGDTLHMYAGSEFFSIMEVDADYIRWDG